jgi:hypothetical protein
MSAKWTIQIMRIIGHVRLILMDMGHRLMTYTTQLILKIISILTIVVLWVGIWSVQSCLDIIMVPVGFTMHPQQVLSM